MSNTSENQRDWNDADWVDDPLERLSDDQLEQLKKRLRACRKLGTIPARTRLDVEFEAAGLGLDPATLYRDLNKLDGEGSTRDIAPAKPGFPLGLSRLHPRQDEIIHRYLVDYHVRAARPSLSDTTEKIGDQCEDEGFGRPTRAAVKRRLAKLPPVFVAGRREGRAAAHKATPAPGRLEVSRPRELYQIDHTLADVIVLDGEYLKPIGRAWLTVVVDVYSRMIVAFWVGLDPPSILRAGSAMELAVAPKADWLASRGLDWPWPTDGLPEGVHNDHGSDLRSRPFRRALLNQGVQPKLRRKGKPHWGAHVERLIGTLMGRCRLLPGATHNSRRARRDYDSETAARVVVDELEMWFAHEILGRYHNTPHEGLGGKTPLEVWTAGTENRPPRYPADPVQFRVDLLPEEKRTITPQGIQFYNEEYYSPELGAAFLRGEREVVVKFDPREFSEIYVRLPNGFTAVGMRFPHRGPPPPLWLRKLGMRSLSKEQKRDRGAIRQAAAKAEAVIETAANRYARQRRQAERLQHDRRGASQMRAGLSNAPEPNRDDDWGGVFSGEDQ